MDPNRLDKAPKQLNHNNTANNIANMQQPNELKLSQQAHQHNAPLHYYPMVHQHNQFHGKQQHQLPVQSPLLFSISPGNQIAYSNTPHRHFQQYPQYQPQPVQNDAIYSTHHHLSREPLPVNQVSQEPVVHSVQPQIQPPQTLDLQQRNQVNQVQQQVQSDVQKDSTSKTSPSKLKSKENDKIQLRSPSAKRPENAPVTMQGWLYKQGSEGLMLWKKRWFVLSEFCLFYYKSSTENKILGSILLPSYKVSVCDAEDKVNRKHAFKCEHVNMRTYILAADSHELMMRWIHVLNLACILQTTTSKEAIEARMTNQLTAQNKSSEPAGQTMVYNNGPASTSSRSFVHTHTPSNVTDFSNSSQQELSQYNQPLYANAPPKPRRLVDGFCSPGSEILDRGYSPHESQSVKPRNSKSPSFVYDKPSQTPQLMKPDRLMIYKDHLQHPQGLIAQNVDRRTPDTYGRSKTVKSPRHPSDYEDIYNQQGMYKRPLSPGEIEIRSIKGYPSATNYKMYPPVNLRPKDFVLYDGTKAPAALPRPHSADFLEHRVQDDINPISTQVTQPMRPKSSLDINMYTKDEYSTYDKLYKEKNSQTQKNSATDNYFYSQERYAEKMRKSAQYLQKMPIQYTSNELTNRKVNNRRNTESPMSYNTTGSFGSSSYQQQPVRSRSALSDGSFLCVQGLENETLRMDYSHHLDQNLPYNARSMGQDQFIRSASARLAQVAEMDMPHSDSGNFRQDGERKREESMKRLLEWKQRMLQSPLNRKAQGYRSNFVKEPNTPHTNSYIGEKKTKKTVVNSRKPAPAHTVQYNSYSSDDEENGESSKTSMHQAQAGRTMDALQSHISESLTLTQSDSATAAPEEPSTSDCQDEITLEIKTSGELVKAILSEFQEPQDDAAYEENYMPMSPKKCILRSISDTNSESTIIAETEENHYVEMTQGNIDTNIKMQNNFDGQYEMVYFRDEKTEPVYMELRRLNKNRDLPDILSSSKEPNNKSNKSESSDADDEASKDLDSLDHQNQPNTRFSLSDTFRPASYYLGVSRSTLQELQDSSDSELVSPPPIPTSSPPLEDEEGSIRSDKNSQKASEKLRYLKDECESCSDVNSEHQGIERPVSASSHSQLNFSVSIQDDLENSILEDSLSETGRVSVSHRKISEYENFFIDKKHLQNSSIKSASLSMDNLRIRGRSESVLSTSAEINSFLASSTCSTPIIHTELQSRYSHPNSEEIHLAAPYYYSDICENLGINIDSGLSTLTLNNQRESICGSKRDISRIINPIKGNENFGSDKRESQTQKLAAEARSVSVEFLNFTDKSENIDKKNIYESDTLKRQKTEDNVTLRKRNPKERNVYSFRSSNKFETKHSPIKKSLSLEGILENVLNESTAAGNEARTHSVEPEASEGSYLWEEDSVWRDRLRTASQRHTKSMDDLDCIDISDTEISQKRASRGITRYVTYVNDSFFKPDKLNREESGKSEIKKIGSFLIDRETLRQWDLLSSAPSDDQLLKVAMPGGAMAQRPSGDTVVDLGEGSCNLEGTATAQAEASGSISINTREAAALGRDTFPKSGSAKKPWVSNLENSQTHSVADFNQCPKYGYNDRQEDFRRSLNDLSVHSKMNLSAGELLGRTHEELVLLLIQLRRQQSQIFQAIESCYNEIDTIQMQMHNIDQMRRNENLQKLDRIKQSLIDLENQYEKGKPLVNLVDNMVKLGSLYRVPTERNDDISRLIREKIQFNRHIQERRLLEEEKREWDRMEPSPFQLQEKVKQLYQLDGLIQEESRNLHNLQRDKEDIERALGGLRNKLMKGYNNSAEMEQAKRQQNVLENELSRVHFMLAQHSKRLEETVAGNARLEQELLILKQKLQLSRHQRTSPHQFTNSPEIRESLPYLTSPNPVFGHNMERVQKKIDDLQKQREELRLQVRQLTDRSNNSQQLLKQAHMPDTLNSKKKPTSSWRETDLDTMNNIDHGYGDHHDTDKPLYIYTNTKHFDTSDHLHNAKTSDSTSEDTTYFSEKPEIKTVRIVKRESERRQRDRDKISTGKCDSLTEEDDFHPPPPPNYYYEKSFCNSLPERSQIHKQKPSELSPVFKSEAARQIITEMGKKPTQAQRRSVPREKRRHYTAPHDNSTASVFGNLEERRARDDLDIERALRQRIDAPDIVRSTLSNKELKYNEETIDSILSTPNKIFIPERYIPEQSPQLSPEEQERRMKKVESIKKMLSDSAIISTGVPSTCTSTDENNSKKANAVGKSSQSSYILEEKKQREHLLQLNQLLAKQVMEISKVVAARTLEKLPLKQQAQTNDDEDGSSPVTPLPLYQQRENYYS